MTTKKSKKLNLSDLRKIIKEELSEVKPTHFDGIRIPDAADLSNKAIELSKAAMKAHIDAARAFLMASKEASRQGDTEEASRLKHLAATHQEFADSILKKMPFDR